MGDKSPKSKRKQEDQKQAKVHKLEKAAEDARTPPAASPAEGPGRNGSPSKH